MYRVKTYKVIAARDMGEQGSYDFLMGLAVFIGVFDPKSYALRWIKELHVKLYLKYQS